MSLNRALAITLAVGLAGLGGCATRSVARGDIAPGVTPTEQFPLQTVTRPEGVLLAPHNYGLSQPQTLELAKLADSWRERGEGKVLIEAPSRGGGDASATAYAARDALTSLGVPREAIDLVGYMDTAERAPVRVSVLQVVGDVRDCGRSWADLSKTAANQPTRNFGCAVNSNLAAMIADPNDIDRAQAMTPVDAGRRQVVIDKYRQGQVTSAERDGQADGAVSKAVD